ncbi:MAG: DUF3095 domain-containing protein [bacterium]|nr:DUF3095 domain-containing protein [bacterium]
MPDKHMLQDDHFYEHLTGFRGFSEFTEIERYTPLPPDWFVVITDVEGSTEAIGKGKYKEVNALGAASIVAVLNAVTPLRIPYVFGGDGATLCVPPSGETAVQAALVATKQMAIKSFGLQLRIGMVPMGVICDAGHKVLVAKYQPYPHYNQAMFLGDGLRYAESLVKGRALHSPGQTGNPFLVPEDQIEPNCSFEGFECRWNEIPSPHEENVAIIVQALEKENQDEEAVYTQVSQKIIEIYGQEESHHPIRREQLKMTASLRKLATENGIRNSLQPFWKRWHYVLRLKVVVFVARWFMRKGIKTETTDWSRYKQTLIANTDYRKFDECLRMVLSGTQEQRERLLEFLEGLRKEGKIVFGIHPAPNSLITCLIFNYDTDHVHFLDGSNGGYALAAKEMKKQLKECET